MTATPLSREVLLAYLDRHSSPEYSRDLDATMATMATESSEEYLPLNYRMVGDAGIRELYRRVMANAIPRFIDAEMLTVAYGDSHIVTEKNIVADLPDGTTAMIRALAVVVFEPESGDVISERVYLDRAGAELMREALGPEFTDMPGIEQF